MRKGVSWVCVAAAGILAAAAAVGPAVARSLKFCNVRPALTVEQAEFAGAISLFGDRIDEFVTYTGPDQDLFTTIKICAKEVGPRLCTDKLLMGLLNPNPLSSKGAVIGGAVGYAMGHTSKGDGLISASGLLGAMVGAEIGGTIEASVEVASCNKQRLEVVAPAMAATKGFRVPNLAAVDGNMVEQFLVDRYRAGRMTGAQLEKVTELLGQIEKVARETR